MSRCIVSIIVILLFSFYLGCGSDTVVGPPVDMPDGPEITVQKVHELISQDQEIVLLDVRTLDEFNSDTGHLASSRNIPVQDLANRLDELNDVKKSDIVVYCKSGGRSALAQTTLADNGFRAWSMTGGITQWIAMYDRQYLDGVN